MGGLVQVLEHLPANDPHRAFIVDKLRQMADAVAKIQSPDGLWRPGLLDAADYSEPETSGSAFFVYALAWGVNHKILDRTRFEPVVKRGWAGLLQHVYSDGRLGCVQPIGAAPGRIHNERKLCLWRGSISSRWFGTRHLGAAAPSAAQAQATRRRSLNRRRIPSVHFSAHGSAEPSPSTRARTGTNRMPHPMRSIAYNVVVANLCCVTLRESR